MVKTEKAEISGRALIVATNAYTGEFSKSLMPAMAHEVMPVLSWQMATQPLSDNGGKTIIPGRQAMSDTHGELYFARYDARNRLVTGGAVIGPGNKPERLKARVAERLQRLWPQIGGRIRLRLERLCRNDHGFPPRIHRLGRNAYGWTGCNGRAVALSIALGDELSKAVRGVPEKDLALPFSEPVPIVAHGLLRRLAPLMLMLYRRRDARGIGLTKNGRIALAREIAAGNRGEQRLRIGVLRIAEHLAASPCSTTAPSFMTATRSQIWAATRRSWVMKTIDRPSRWRSSASSFSTCACTETSSAETGSSATSTSGFSASARARPMRCRWPPENSCG